MFQIFVILLSVLQIVLSKNYCEDKEPLATVFTLDYMTYPRKDVMFYRTLTNKTFKEGIQVNYQLIYEPKEFKFDKIETGFMISRTPNCSGSQSLCDQINELKGTAFLIGIKKNSQEYKVFRFNPINPIYPILTPVNHLKIGILMHGPIGGKIWPITASTENVYLHSTYDERTFTIIHLVYKKGEKVLFTYSLLEMRVDFNYVEHQIEANIVNQHFKGFFHMLSDPKDDPKNRNGSVFIYAIIKVIGDEPDSVLELSESFTFIKNKSMALDDITGCSSVTTIPTTAPDVTSNPTQSESSETIGPEIIGPESIGPESISTESSDSVSDGGDGGGDDGGDGEGYDDIEDGPVSVMPTTVRPESDSDSTPWLLIVAVLIVVLIVLGIVIYYFYPKSDEKSKITLRESKDSESALPSTSGQPSGSGETLSGSAAPPSGPASPPSGSAAPPSGSAAPPPSTESTVTKRTDDDIV